MNTPRPFQHLLRALLVIASLLITLSISTFAHAKEIDPDQGFFIPKFGDWPSDAKEAQSAGKKAMLLFFEWDECPYCQKMRKTALRQESVQKFFNQHFAAIAVDIAGSVAIKAFDGSAHTEKSIAQAYRVSTTPTLMLVDFNGQVLYRHTGYFYETKAMLAFGQFLVKGDFSQKFKP